MIKSKLITLFQHLNSKEIIRFTDYVHSPFYNKHSEVQKLCVYIAKYISDPKKEHKLEKERIYKYVYSNKPFDANMLHSISSKLLTLLHDFLVITTHEDKKNAHLIKVLAELRQRKQHKDYDAILRKIERNEESIYEDVEDLYWEKFLFCKELDVNFLTQGGRSYNENLQLKNDYLDLFFITKKLKIACDMVSRNRIIGSNYEYRLVDELFVYLNNSSYANEPTIKIYASVLNMLLDKEDNDESYTKVKEWTAEYRGVFTNTELKNIYDYLENYCMWQFRKNTASDKYMRELLEISKFLVQHQINFVDGYLLDADYKNIGTSAINLGDYAWAKTFIEEYKDNLIPQIRESAYSYLMALLRYSSKDYKGALQALYNVVFTNWTYHAGAKIIQMRIYYELNEGEALYSLMDAFKNYLKRNKQITETDRLIYDNFINITKQAYKLKESQDYISKVKFEKEVLKLQSNFEETKLVASKAWLKEIVFNLKI